MTISYGTAGAIAYAGSGATTISPAYPGSVGTNDLLLLAVAQKPSTANGGSISTPSGFTAVGSALAFGGYGTTVGADTGNLNLWIYSRKATGTESGSLSVTIGTNNVAWAGMLRLDSSFANLDWLTGVTFGAQTSAPGTNWAGTATSNPGVQSGDLLASFFAIPTDVTTPSQFSSHSLAAGGATVGGATEIAEPDSSTANDIGGVLAYASVTAGTATANPSWSASLAGTLTNVRGPFAIVRVRENPWVTGTSSVSIDPNAVGAGTVSIVGVSTVGIVPGGAAGNVVPALLLGFTHSGRRGGVFREPVYGRRVRYLPRRPPSGAFLGQVQAGAGLSGASTTSVVPAGAAAGTTLVSGVSASATQPGGQAAGTVGIVGASSVAVTPAGAAAGTVAIVGASTGTVTPAGASAGVVGATPIVGQSAVSIVPAGSAAGAVAIAATSSQSVVPGRTSAGAVAIAGTSTQAVAVGGTASGSVGATPIVGTSSQAVIPTGASSGTVAVVGTSSQSVVPGRTSAGACAIVGASTQAVAVGATASGVVGATPIVGTSSQAVTPAGASSGTVAVVGTSSRAVVPAGSAAGSIAIAGQSSQAIAVGGTAAGVIGWPAITGTSSRSIAPSNAAAGRVDVIGVSVATVLPAGAAAGQIAIRGTSAAGIVPVGAAEAVVGSTPLIGTSSRSIAVSGVGAGVVWSVADMTRFGPRRIGNEAQTAPERRLDIATIAAPQRTIGGTDGGSTIDGRVGDLG